MSCLPLGPAHDHEQDGERDVVLALSSVWGSLEREADWRRRIRAASLVTGSAASAADCDRPLDRSARSFMEVFEPHMPPQRKDPVPAIHVCPACGRPQTKIRRMIGGVTRGSTIYVCARGAECSVGVTLSKITNWAVV